MNLVRAFPTENGMTFVCQHTLLGMYSTIIFLLDTPVKDQLAEYVINRVFSQKRVSLYSPSLYM